MRLVGAAVISSRGCQVAGEISEGVIWTVWVWFETAWKVEVAVVGPVSRTEMNRRQLVGPEGRRCFAGGLG
ncbi:MAG: hypothetical protein RI897_3159 [Verrucomicrobiota bacterium]|jgi:hypothetical protein